MGALSAEAAELLSCFSRGDVMASSSRSRARIVLRGTSTLRNGRTDTSRDRRRGDLAATASAESLATTISSFSSLVRDFVVVGLARARPGGNLQPPQRVAQKNAEKKLQDPQDEVQVLEPVPAADHAHLHEDPDHQGEAEEHLGGSRKAVSTQAQDPGRHVACAVDGEEDDPGDEEIGETIRKQPLTSAPSPISIWRIPSARKTVLRMPLPPAFSTIR